MSCQVKVHLVVDGCEHDLLVPIQRKTDPRLCAAAGAGGGGFAPACGCLDRVPSLRGLIEKQLSTNLEECIRLGRVVIRVK